MFLFQKSLFSTTQDFMRIALMGYIKEDFIDRRVKHLVQSHRDFHHAEIRT